MLSFKNVTLDDVETVKPYLLQKKSFMNDFTLGGLFMWRDYEKSRFSIDNDTLYILSAFPNEPESFYMPIGGDTEKALETMLEWCGRNDFPRTLYPVSESELEFLRERYEIIEDIPRRYSFDYIYNAEELAFFPGKRFGGQRNHVNKFKKTYTDYSFEKMNKNNIFEALDFCSFFEKNDKKTDAIAIEDLKKERELIENLDLYNAIGGILRIEGKVVGITVGEIKDDTLHVHAEKGNREYDGLYQMLVSSFASMILPTGIKFISREDDAGDEGLRTSKLSYHPCKLIEKHTVTIGKKR